MLSSCGERGVTLCLERFAFRQLSGCLIGSGFEAGYGGSDLPAVSHWKEKFSLVFGFYQGTSGPGSLLVGTRVMQVRSQRFVTCGKEQHGAQWVWALEGVHHRVTGVGSRAARALTERRWVSVTCFLCPFGNWCLGVSWTESMTSAFATKYL